MLNVWIAQQWAKAANALKFDPTQPGQKPLSGRPVRAGLSQRAGFPYEGPEAERAVCRTNVHGPDDRADRLGGAPPTVQDECHRGARRRPGLLPVEEYTPLAPEILFFRPDDRTVVFTGEEFPADSEKRLLKHLRRATPPPAPAFAQGKDWDRFLHGPASSSPSTIAEGAWRSPSRGTALWMRPLSAVTSPVEHTDLWALGLEDDDQIVFRGVGTCPDGGASESTARAIGDLLDLARKQLEMPDAETTPRRAGEEKAYRMAQAFLKGYASRARRPLGPRAVRRPGDAGRFRLAGRRRGHRVLVNCRRPRSALRTA